MNVLVYSHQDTSGVGGLTVGQHLVPRDELVDYEVFFLDGRMTFQLPVNQWVGLNQQLNEQTYNLYQTVESPFPSGSLKIGDSADDHYMSIVVGEDFTANREINITLGNGDRNLALEADLSVLGNATISGNHSGNSSGTNTGDTINVGTTPLASGTNDRPLYQAAGVVTQSTKWRFDGSDMTLIDPTAATVGSQTVNSPKFYLEGAKWRTDTTVSETMKVRFGVTPVSTNVAFVLSPTLNVDFFSAYGGNIWQSAVSYGADPASYTNTKLRLRSPVEPAWGSDIFIDYLGNWTFRNPSGGLAGMNPGAIGTPGYESLYIIGFYAPEIRASWGNKILLSAGRSPSYWGDNVGNSGTEYVQSDLPIGIGTTSAPSDRLHIQTSSNAALGARIINAGTGATARTHLRIGESVAGDQLFTLMYANTGNSAYGGNTAVMAAGTGASGGLMFAHEGNYPIYFLTNGGNYRMAVHGGGNITVGSAFDSFSAKFAIVSTTEQLRLVYDGSNYFKTTVGSTGIVTLDAVGSGAKFVFSDRIEVASGGILGQIEDDSVDVTFNMSGGQVRCDSAGGFLFDTSINPLSVIGDWNANGNSTRCEVDDNNQIIADYGKAMVAIGTGGAFALYGGKLFQRVSSETTAGTTQENLYTYTLPAASLLNDGDTIKCEFGGIFTANTNVKRIFPKFATNVLATGQVSTAGATDWTVDFYIIRVSNTVVRYVVEFTATGDASIIESGELTGLNLTTTAYDIDLDGRSVSAAGELTAHSGFGLYYPGA